MKAVKNLLCVVTMCAALAALAAPVQAAVTFGLSTGFASAQGKDTGHTYSNFTPYSFFVGFIGDSDYAFEIGYSQLADIEEKTRTEELSISMAGLFLSGRYFLQFSGTGFGFVKFGVHQWSGSAKLSDIETVGNKEKASASGAGFTPILGFGADFVFPGGDFGMRVEFEHLDKIGDGLFDNTVSGQSDAFVSEGYSYDRVNFGVQVAF